MSLSSAPRRLLVVSALLLLSLLPAPSTAGRVFTVCSVASDADQTSIALATKHAVAFYGQPSGGGYGRLPAGVTFAFYLLGNGTLSRRNYALSFAVATTEQCGTAATCDALSGPGYSFLAVAMSPVVGPATAWVDPFATSVSLGVKSDHPSFNRIIPNDSVGAAMGLAVFTAFGWSDVNILCLDEAYGRSVSQGLSEAVLASGGRVHQSQCLLNDATPEHMRAVLENIRAASPSKLVFMAMIVGAPFDRLIDVITAHRFDHDLVFVFSDAACTGGQLSYGALRSGLCTTYTANATLLAPYYASYKARNVSADEAMLLRTGWTQPTGFNFTEETLLGALAHDATLHAMASLASLQPGQTPSEAPRTTVTTGATGVIDLDSNGDRPTADAVVFNARGVAGQHRAIAFIRNGSVFFTDGSGSPDVVRDSPPEMLLLGALSSTPPAVAASPSDSSSTLNVVVVVVAAALAAVLLVLVAGIALFALMTRLRRRAALARVPSDPDTPFTAFFVSVKNEAALRDDFSAEAADAVCRGVEHIVSTAARRHDAYVSKSLGAHVLVLSKSPHAALACIAEATRAFQTHRWQRYAPLQRQRTAFSLGNVRGSTRSELSSIDESFESRTAGRRSEVRSSKCPQSTRPLPPFAPAISVGCALAVGFITTRPEEECLPDEVPWRHGGLPIDQAAGLADVAAPGQVLVAASVTAAVEDDDLEAVGVLRECTTQVLPGMKHPVEIDQLDVVGVEAEAFCDTVAAPQALNPIGAGGVLAALEADAGGVAGRNVAVVALYCPALQCRDTTHGLVDQVVEAATDAATPLKGKVLCVLGPTVFITVNGTGPVVSRAVPRAAAIALDAVGAVDAVAGRSFAGIACGPSAVGQAPGVGTEHGLGAPGHIITTSSVAQRAVALARVAETSPCAVVAGSSAFSELQPEFLLRTVDIIGDAALPRLPDLTAATRPFSPPVAASPSGELIMVAAGDESPDEQALNRPLRPTTAASPAPANPLAALAATRPVGEQVLVRAVHGVVSESAAAGEDEWMYQLTDAESGNPFGAANLAMGRVLNGAEPTDASDEAVATVLDLIRRCDGNSFTEKVAAYALWRGNAATARFPQGIM